MVRVYKYKGYNIEMLLKRVDSSTIEYTAEIWDKDNNLIIADVDVVRLYLKTRGTTKMTTTTIPQRVLDRIKETEGHAIVATVHTVSRSNMSRTATFILMNADGTEVMTLNFLIHEVTGTTLRSDQKLHLKGCGMDMLFYTLYRFYQAIGLSYEDALEYASHYKFIG